MTRTPTPSSLRRIFPTPSTMTFLVMAPGPECVFVSPVLCSKDLFRLLQGIAVDHRHEGPVLIDHGLPDNEVNVHGGQDYQEPHAQEVKYPGHHEAADRRVDPVEALVEPARVHREAGDSHPEDEQDHAQVRERLERVVAVVALVCVLQEQVVRDYVREVSQVAGQWTKLLPVGRDPRVEHEVYPQYHSEDQ